MTNEKNKTDCCDKKPDQASEAISHAHPKKKFDLIFSGSVLILIITIGLNILLSAFGYSAPMYLHHFVHASLQILMTMWWSILLGIFIIGLMSKISRDYFTAIMGRSDKFSGLLRAVVGGLFLDLCCHGILLVAAKLYERGVSLAQVVTFLVASPWNSVSLTLVLISLIGLQWTMLYILGSVLIALTTGFILQKLTQKGYFPENPNTQEDHQDFNLADETKALFKSIKFSASGTVEIIKTGWRDGQMIIKWLLFGTIIAASLRTFVSPEVFQAWLGPNLAGLFITLIIATIVEICSEGSAPIASEIVTSGKAPGNGFTFLMAGVATDYTELLIIKEFTGKWGIALAVPLITVPQILLIGWLMNMAGS